MSIIPFDKYLEERLIQEFEEKATPEFINMIRAGKAAYEHAYNGFISKEKFLEWIGMMFDGGQNQREIREGKAHGRILINSADIINVGCYLSFLGKQEGYLSSSKEEILPTSG